MTVNQDDVATAPDTRQADADAVLAVEGALTAIERQKILDYAGPRLKGAAVADVLALAVDNDANLGLTEPFHVAHGAALSEAIGGDAEGYDGALRSRVTAYSVQAVAILTGKVPTFDHVRALTVDALKIATGEVSAAPAQDTTTTALMEARRVPHAFVGTAVTCASCGLADGAIVHRQYTPGTS